MAEQQLSRNWATEVYPESVKTDWLKTLQELHVDGFVSPLHDKDVDDDGCLKKPHYHILLTFRGKKSRNQFQDIVQSIGGVGAEKIQDKRGYVRYLCHLDEKDPKKFHYDTREVTCLGSLNYAEESASKKDGVNAVREMMQWVRENECTCFCDLMNYASEEQEEWFNALLESSSQIMIAYIKSYCWKKGTNNEKHYS